MFRDPRYLVPVGMLIGVILVSAVLAYESSGPRAVAAPQVATATEAVSDATAPPDAAAADAHRLQDLTKLRDGFLAYRRLHGRFPITKDGVTTICAGEADPGCVIASVAPGVVYADRDQPYWFISNGSRVVLVARGQSAPVSAQCPRALPPELTGAPLICLAFERPAQ